MRGRGNLQTVLKSGHNDHANICAYRDDNRNSLAHPVLRINFSFAGIWRQTMIQSVYEPCSSGSLNFQNLRGSMTWYQREDCNTTYVTIDSSSSANLH